MKRTLFFLLLLIISGSSLFAMVKDEDRIQEDPQLLQGKLDNGLSYYILPNQLPEKRVELRLIVNAGSVLEEEDQLGLAHFLEHMAFNGTRMYPKNELVDYLQSLGMGFGPEVNAFTSFDETVYKLTVPTDKEGALEEGINVLEEWAFHITLEEEDIDAERPVIIEEWRSGRNALRRMQEKAFPDIYNDSIYGYRLPIGTRESIETFSSDRLRDFYKDWYRPELMSLVVVGDIDAAEVETLIKERFSGYENSPDAPTRIVPEVPDHEEDIFTLQKDNETRYISLEIIKKSPHYPLNNTLDYRKYISEQLYLSMFNNRIAHFVRQGEPPFIDAYASVRTSIRPIDQFSLGVIAGPGRIREGFTAFWKEVLRMQRYGFSQAEWQQAKEELQSSYDYIYGQKDSMYSQDLVEMVQYSVIKKEPYPSLEWEWKTSKAILDDITQEEVLQKADQWFSDGNRVFFSMERSGEDLLSEEEILQIMASVEGERILPMPEEKELGELVPNPPVPGEILSIKAPGEWEAPEDMGVYLMELANGARVFLKPTDFRENEIKFRAISDGGASLVDDENVISASLATTAIEQSGLGEFSVSDLERLLATRNLSLTAELGDFTESLEGYSTPEDLETLLQLVYLNFTAPAYDGNSWNAYENRLRPYLESKENDPREQYRRLMTRVLYDNHPRHEPLTPETLERMDYEEAFRIFKERYLTGGDFDFIFVGDFKVDEISGPIAQWLGSLPPQEEREKWQDRDIKFTSDSHKEILELGEEPLSVVTLIINGPMEWSYQESLNLQALGMALEDRLQEVIREEEGGTYGVGHYVQTRDIPRGEYAFYIQFSCDPDRRESLTESVDREIQNFIQGVDLEEYAHNVREALKNSLEEDLQNNQWWLREISFLAHRNAQVTSDWHRRKEFIEEISPELLQQMARRYLGEGTVRQELILNPAPVEVTVPAEE